MGEATEEKSFGDVESLVERIRGSMADENGNMDSLDCLAALGIVVATIFVLSGMYGKLDGWVDSVRAAIAAGLARGVGRTE